MSEQLSYKFVQSIEDVGATDWRQLTRTDNPFIQYEFLAALESSSTTCSESGWTVNHLVGYQGNQLVVAMPLYIKLHSYGEYVFDFQWANAFHQSGLEYYPKLLSAIPFTPSTGARILIADSLDEHQVYPSLLKKLKAFALSGGYSSWHLLFPEKLVFKAMQDAGCIQRVGVQYHWLNRDYQDFADYLDALKPKKRKNIKRERNKLKQQNVRTRFIEGKDIPASLWERFYLFYQVTYVKRSGHGGYLNLDFFQTIGQLMPDSILMSVAEVDDKLVAAALFFKDKKSLYGRYWGCVAEFEFLHFELCYYMGIEYCIRQHLLRFDAGAQGEHKIARGFVPIETYSAHWIQNVDFSRAIQSFLHQEVKMVKQSIENLQTCLPYKSAK